jgi:hypothetical protein
MNQNKDNNLKLTPEIISIMVDKITFNIKNGDEIIKFQKLLPQPSNHEWLVSFDNIIQKSNENPNNIIFTIVKMSYNHKWAVILIYIPNKPIYMGFIFSDNTYSYNIFSHNRELPDFLTFMS